MLYYIIYFEKLFDKFKYYIFKCFLKIDLQSKFYDNSIIRRGNNMIDNKEKTYPEQKSLPRGESSLSPQDSDRDSDINNEIDSDDEIVDYDEIGFDDIDYTTNYFNPTAEEIDMEIEIADLLNRIDSDCVSLIDEDK